MVGENSVYRMIFAPIGQWLECFLKMFNSVLVTGIKDNKSSRPHLRSLVGSLDDFERVQALLERRDWPSNARGPLRNRSWAMLLAGATAYIIRIF